MLIQAKGTSDTVIAIAQPAKGTHQSQMPSVTEYASSAASSVAYPHLKARPRTAVWRSSYFCSQSLNLSAIVAASFYVCGYSLACRRQYVKYNLHYIV